MNHCSSPSISHCQWLFSKGQGPGVRSREAWSKLPRMYNFLCILKNDNVHILLMAKKPTRYWFRGLGCSFHHLGYCVKMTVSLGTNMFHILHMALKSALLWRLNRFDTYVCKWVICMHVFDRGLSICLIVLTILANIRKHWLQLQLFACNLNVNPLWFFAENSYSWGVIDSSCDGLNPFLPVSLSSCLCTNVSVLLGATEAKEHVVPVFS